MIAAYSVRFCVLTLRRMDGHERVHSERRKRADERVRYTPSQTPTHPLHIGVSDCVRACRPAGWVCVCRSLPLLHKPDPTKRAPAVPHCRTLIGHLGDGLTNIRFEKAAEQRVCDTKRTFADFHFIPGMLHLIWFVCCRPTARARSDRPARWLLSGICELTVCGVVNLPVFVQARHRGHEQGVLAFAI